MRTRRAEHPRRVRLGKQREDAPRLGRLRVERKSGSERFRVGKTVLGFDLLAFWRWSVSDLVSNATRGRLAEYIVAQALGVDTSSPRDEWSAWDLETPEGTKVEVKSSAFLQVWNQRAYSKVVFSTPKTRAWNPETNRQEPNPRRHADVYVFALLDHKDKATVDPMDLSQWRFFVTPTAALDARTRSQHSITHITLKKLAKGSARYSGLRKAVREASAEHRRISTKGTGPPKKG